MHGKEQQRGRKNLMSTGELFGKPDENAAGLPAGLSAIIHQCSIASRPSRYMLQKSSRVLYLAHQRAWIETLTLENKFIISATKAARKKNPSSYLFNLMF